MDVIADLGGLFLGTRLKRLAERFQAGAAAVIERAGLSLQPAHMPLLAALDRRAMTVGELVDAIGFSQPGITRSVGQLVALGLVQSERGRDQRERRLSLTPAGKEAMVRIKQVIWPSVGAAVDALCAGLSGSLLEQIAGLEAALDAQSLELRAARADEASLQIVDYCDANAAHFRDLNREWIEAMFTLEPADSYVLDDPKGRIVDPGGAILFVKAPGLGIIGTGALEKRGEGRFELTKMAVRASARGLKAGEYLLAALLDRARAMAAQEVYLLSNRKCAAAVHLYEKVGFQHDARIMAEHGAKYQRCDVAMRRIIG